LSVGIRAQNAADAVCERRISSDEMHADTRCGHGFYYARQRSVALAAQLEVQFDEAAWREGYFCFQSDETTCLAHVADLATEELAGIGRDTFSEARTADSCAAATFRVRSPFLVVGL